MEPETEREILIRLDTKLTGLCTQFTTVKTENREDHAKIWDSLDTNLDKKLPAKFFFWIMPFVILGLIAIGGLASDNHYSLGKTEKVLELHLDQEPAKQEVKKEIVKDAVTQSIIIKNPR